MHFDEDNLIEKTEKFYGKYRIKSTRLEDWDYSLGGAYFVTICTKNRENYLGEIVGGKMQYSHIGRLVAQEWENTKKIRLNVKLDEWVVMPNHLHGIIIVETHCNASLRQNGNTQKLQKNRFGPQSNNLASIIRGFKGASTKNIHISGFCKFAWQSRFYDHIIHDENELNRIREYIKNNPLQWNCDRNNIENLFM